MEDFPDGLRKRYEPLRTLGRGGMGSVWAARDRRDGSTVAVKVLAEALAGDDDMRERLRREATVAAGICHPNLIRILDTALDDTPPALVMELIEGRSLRTLLQAERPLAPERVLDLVESLASALGALHAQTIVHRDVKPDNVMIRSDGSPVLLDLGLVRHVDGTALTATGTILGTPAYLAPEVCRGERPGPVADVFALGVLLAELLSPADLFPTAGPALMRCVTQRAAGKAAVPIPEAIPEALRSLVETLTAPDTADRPADGAAARTAIAAARGELTAGETPTTSTRATRTTRPPRRPSVQPTRALPARPSAPSRRRLPLVLVTALLLTVILIALHHDEVAPATSSASSPAPGEGRRPLVATDASIATFKKALDYLAAAPSRATLKPLRRAAQDLDPDAARRGIAWYLGSYFPDREVSLATIERLRRGVALLPLLVELLHDLDEDSPEGIRAVDVDVAMALWRFSSEVGKQTVEFNLARTRAMTGFQHGASPELRSSLAQTDELETNLREALVVLSRSVSDDGRPLRAHLQLPGLVMRCKTDKQDLIFHDARALADRLPTGGSAEARDDLRALIEFLGLDCVATHVSIAEGLRLSQPLFAEMRRWARERWVPSHGSVAAERVIAMERRLLSSLACDEGRTNEATALLEGVLGCLPWRFQREEVMHFVNYLLESKVLTPATHARLADAGRAVDVRAPSAWYPAAFFEATPRNRLLTGLLQTQAPDDAVVNLTLVADDEDVTTSRCEGVATHASPDRVGHAVRQTLPITVPPGWRRVSLDVSWPGQARIRVWSEVIVLEEPSKAARALALRDALADLTAEPSPATLEPVVNALRSHADPDSSLAALTSVLPSADFESEDPPSLPTIQRAIVLLPLVVKAALQVPRPARSTVLSADLHLVDALIRCADATSRAINRVRIAATRDVLMIRNGVDSSRAAQSLRLETDFRRRLQTAVDSIEGLGADRAPTLHYLGLGLQTIIGGRDGVAGDLLAFAGTLPPAGASNVRTLSAMAQSTAVTYLAKMGRLDEGAARAQALVDLLGIRASFWTLDHCPRDVAATVDAVVSVVEEALRVGATIPAPLILSYLEHLPWLHQREAFTTAILPPDPEVSGGLPETIRALQLRAAQTSPAQVYPSTTKVVSLDATGARLSIGGLASMGVKWRADLLVDGNVVTSAMVKARLYDLTADVRLTNASPVAPGWRHMVVQGTLPAVAGDQPFTLADRWVAVLPEEP